MATIYERAHRIWNKFKELGEKALTKSELIFVRSFQAQGEEFSLYSAAVKSGDQALADLEGVKGNEWMERMRKWDKHRISKEDCAEYRAAVKSGDQALVDLEGVKGFLVFFISKTLPPPF